MQCRFEADGAQSNASAQAPSKLEPMPYGAPSSQPGFLHRGLELPLVPREVKALFVIPRRNLHH